MEQLIIESEKKADAKIESLKGSIKKDIDNILQESHADIKVLRENLASILDNAIERSRKVASQAKEDTIRKTIMAVLYQIIDGIDATKADDLIESLSAKINMEDSIKEIAKLKDDGYISYQDEDLRPSTLISFNREQIQEYIKKL